MHSAQSVFCPKHCTLEVMLIVLDRYKGGKRVGGGGHPSELQLPEETETSCGVEYEEGEWFSERAFDFIDYPQALLLLKLLVAQ